MSHLIVEFNEKYNFNKITCPEGHLITNWDKEDIKTYTASTVMYTPITYNLNDYYCVTEEEHNELMEKHREAIKQEEAERHNKHISGTTTNGEVK